MSSRQEDLNFMPDVHAAVRRRGNRMAYVLTLLTFVFVIVMGVWSKYALLDEVTRGEGRVIPSRKTQVIQNLEGGIVAEILVREGDIVDRGDILVRIDNSAAQASFRDLQSQYYVLKATVERLEAEQTGQPLKFSDDVLKNAPNAAEDQR
ncbi:MAG: biotin/lipoyl-binding protein, partial [Alphaproteobacteria bacterium]